MKMGLSSLQLFLCFIFFVKLGMAQVTPSPTTKLEILKICNNFQNRPLELGFCLSTLSSNLHKEDSNAVDLAQVCMEVGLGNANGTKVFIDQLLQNVTDDLEMRKYIIVCGYSYYVSVDAFTVALGFFNQADYKNMVIAVLRTQNPFADCEDTYGPPKGSVNPLLDRNTDMRYLLDMAVAAGRNLL